MSHLRCTGDFIHGKAEARFVESLWHVYHHLILLSQSRHRRCTPLLRYFVKFEVNADLDMVNADQDTLKAARVDDKLNRFLSFKFCPGTKLDHSGKKRDSVRNSQHIARASEALFFSSYRNYNSPPEFSQSYPSCSTFSSHGVCTPYIQHPRIIDKICTKTQQLMSQKIADRVYTY